MYAIDPRTVIFLSGVMGGLMAVVMWFLRRSYPPRIQGLGEWSSAMGLLFVAGVLAALRGQAPVWVAVALPNLLVMAGTYLLYVGSQRFFGDRPALRAHGAALAAAQLTMLWLIFGDPSYRGRVLVLVVVLGYLFATHARLMVRHAPPLFSSRFVIAVLCAAALIQGLRIESALSLPASGDTLPLSPSGGVYLILYPALLLLLSIGLVLMATDRLRMELEHLATHDSLTQALTRRSLSEACEQELARCRRHGHPLALLIIDLDHFKAVNDSHGHQAGDRVLVHFVQRVQALLRRPDRLGRFGGEEFVVLLPQTSIDEALQVAERIRCTCESNTEAPRCTVSIGVATTDGHCTQDALLARADAALYRAKALGRNRVEGEVPSEPAP